MTTTLWTRWKRLAHRAASIQSMVVLSLLYWLVVAPIGLLRRRTAVHAAPVWTPREPAGSVSLDDARRQY